MTVMQGFVPQSGDGGVGVALISYCDQVMLSVQSDVGQLATTTSAAGAGEKAPVVPLEEAFFAEVQHLKALAQAKAAAAAIATAADEDDDEDHETKKDK